MLFFIYLLIQILYGKYIVKYKLHQYQLIE